MYKFIYFLDHPVMAESTKGKTTLTVGELKWFTGFQSKYSYKTVCVICVYQNERGMVNSTEKNIRAEELGLAFQKFYKEAAARKKFETIVIRTSLIKEVGVSAESIAKAAVNGLFTLAGDRKRLDSANKIVLLSHENDANQIAKDIDEMFRSRRGCKRSGHMKCLSSLCGVYVQKSLSCLFTLYKFFLNLSSTSTQP